MQRLTVMLRVFYCCYVKLCVGFVGAQFQHVVELSFQFHSTCELLNHELSLTTSYPHLCRTNRQQIALSSLSTG